MSLSLTDYAAKYKISVSTLRRRIKNQEVRFEFNEGKYLLPDLSLENIEVSTLRASDPKSNGEISTNNLLSLSDQQLENALSTTQNLIAELKKAYMLILQEKEEQIMLLRDEISDLKTLVRVLETNRPAPYNKNSTFTFGDGA